MLNEGEDKKLVDVVSARLDSFTRQDNEDQQ